MIYTKFGTEVLLASPINFQSGEVRIAYQCGTGAVEYKTVQLLDLKADNGFTEILAANELFSRVTESPMRKQLLKEGVFGEVVRYSTDDNLYAFRVHKTLLDKNKFNCSVWYRGDLFSTACATTRIGAVAKALEQLQKTAFAMPFAEYRMADILTGQI